MLGESSSDENGADTSMGFGNISVEIIKGEIALEKVGLTKGIQRTQDTREEERININHDSEQFSSI